MPASVPDGPRLLAVATASPPRRFTQEETYQLAGYKSRRIHDIFLNSDIDYRYLYLEPEGFQPTEDPDQLHRRYGEGAVQIARAAADRCLAQAGLVPADVDCILVCSCTGYLCPDLATILVKEMALAPSVQRGALLGHGCAGALPLLQRAYDHACAYPEQRVLAIAVEICSAAYFIDGSLETVVGNAICADGAAACLLSVAADTGPRLRGFASVLDPSCQSSVGFEQRQGKLRIILAPTIRDLAPPIIERALDALLSPRGLARSDIRFWLMHPGGRKVIDKVQAALRLSDEELAYSRHVYRNYGNMSSATVLFVLNEVLQRRAGQAGDLGVLLAVGPGFAAEAALLEW
ncbi:MAG: type III polyketide synthase [Terriglobia bacterium]